MIGQYTKSSKVIRLKKLWGEFMRNTSRFFAIIMLSFMGLILSGCSTPQSKALKEIQVGMDKADVLEIAGNPSRITRHLGQDRWTYEDFSNSSSVSTAGSGKKTTFVYFSEGRVTYVGPAEVNPDSPAAQSQKVTEGKMDSSSFQPVGE
jgi:outer membrane protein assembly factor BamE (lipoprotein component of BamABCDE complex)